MAGSNALGLTIDTQDLADIRRRLGDMEKRAPSVKANALNQTQTVLKNELPKLASEKYTYKRKLQKPRQQRASRKKLSAVL